jgi:tetratricopeptide (TPR) repeat protein
MVYGNRPSPKQEVEVWVLRVPPEWVEGVAPGTAPADLTQRCGAAVAARYQLERQEAFERARATYEAGGANDAGHFVMEGASIWLLHPGELVRRPWTGSRRHLLVLDAQGGARLGTEDDEPEGLAPLSPFEEAAFAGWRLEDMGFWLFAKDAHEKALEQVNDATSLSLLGEVYAGLVRATAKIHRLEEAERLAEDGVRALGARGAPGESIAIVHVRIAEGHLASKQPKHAAAAYARAIPLFPDGDPRIAEVSAAEGLAYLRMGDFAAARAPLERAVLGLASLPDTQRDGFGEAQHNLALVLEHEGELEEADRHARSAIAAHQRTGDGESKSLDSRLTLARILARRGAVADARRVLAELSHLLGPETMAQGLAHWAEGLVEHAESGDTLRTLHPLQQAEKLLAKDPAWARWLAEDLRRLGGA